MTGASTCIHCRIIALERDRAKRAQVTQRIIREMQLTIEEHACRLHDAAPGDLRGMPPEGHA